MPFPYCNKSYDEDLTDELARYIAGASPRVYWGPSIKIPLLTELQSRLSYLNEKLAVLEQNTDVVLYLKLLSERADKQMLLTDAKRCQFCDGSGSFTSVGLKEAGSVYSIITCLGCDGIGLRRAKNADR